MGIMDHKAPEAHQPFEDFRREEARIKRGKRRQNWTFTALFALALSGDPRAVEILSDALSTDVGAVRRAAAAGLLRLTGVDWLEADLAERARLRREWSAEGRQG